MDADKDDDAGADAGADAAAAAVGGTVRRSRGACAAGGAATDGGAAGASSFTKATAMRVGGASRPAPRLFGSALATTHRWASATATVNAAQAGQAVDATLAVAKRRDGASGASGTDEAADRGHAAETETQQQPVRGAVLRVDAAVHCIAGQQHQAMDHEPGVRRHHHRQPGHQ